MGKPMTEEKLIDLIEEALDKFYPNVCEQCGKQFSRRDYIDREDIKEWLKKRGKK